MLYIPELESNLVSVRALDRNGISTLFQYGRCTLLDKTRLKKLYKMTDKGEAEYFLGVAIKRSKEHGRMSLSQEGYIDRLLGRFGMESCRDVLTPSVRRCGENSIFHKRLNENQHSIYRTMVGSLLYISTKTRPDIAEAVGAAARNVESPTTEHWTAVKRILR